MVKKKIFLAAVEGIMVVVVEEGDIDCNKDFIFTEGEQQFFEEKGYSEPIRCKELPEQKKGRKKNQWL